MQYHYVPQEDGRIVRLKNSGEIRTLTGLRAIVDTATGQAYAYLTAEAATPELGSNIQSLSEKEVRKALRQMDEENVSEAQALATEFEQIGWQYEADELERVAKAEGIW